MSKIHESQVKMIQQKLKDWRVGKTNKPIKIKHFSNCMRKKSKERPAWSPLHLNRVLSVDATTQIAWVEPGVTMQQLALATLPYGLIPPVIPEFKGITVGGAINGAALESSSHFYGQFNDTCQEYEVLTGNGEVIIANASQHNELFHAISGSYGTLGTLLSVKIALVKAAPYVHLSYHHFSSSQEAIEFLSQKNSENSPPDFMEGIVYDQKLTVVVLGRYFYKEFPNKIYLKKPWSPWFYQHVCQAEKEEIIPLYDYLFRHDRGAFWMGGYAAHSRMTFSYLTHKVFSMISPEMDLSAKLFPKYCLPKLPGKIFRTLFGWMMGSQTLYGSLHGNSEAWFEEHFVIQDFYLPKKTASTFATFALNKYRIAPIWICPIRSTTKPQWFSPHQREQKELLFDIGIYGFPYQARGPLAVKEMEDKVIELGGRKMFYCHCYYDEERFWKIYPKLAYQELRKKYQLDLISQEITQKVLK